MQLKRENHVKKHLHECQNNYTNCVEVNGWASSKGVQDQVFDLWPDLRSQVYLGNEEFIEKVHKSKT
jgi:hypothetical protein